MVATRIFFTVWAQVSMIALILADTHFSDRAQDAHRFGLFNWLLRQQQRHSVDATFILGDITERKDNHSATLVNRIVEGLTQLTPPVYVLMGNHDFIDPTSPYFKFISNIPGLKFVTQPRL